MEEREVYEAKGHSCGASIEDLMCLITRLTPFILLSFRAWQEEWHVKGKCREAEAASSGGAQEQTQLQSALDPRVVGARLRAEAACSNGSLQPTPCQTLSRTQKGGTPGWLSG